MTLERSADNATWSNVKTNQTDAAGGYQFSNNKSAAGTYYYRTAYDDSETYANAMSNVVSPPTRCASVVESRSSAPAAPC